jgi:hypothetical protein
LGFIFKQFCLKSSTVRYKRFSNKKSLFYEEVMKNYKRTSRGILVGIILVSIILAGCSDIYTPPDPSGSNPTVDDGLTRHDYLALLKTQDNHKVGIEELRSMASSLLKTNENMRSVVSSNNVITGTRKLGGFDGKRFASSTGARSIGSVTEEDPVEIYELTIGDSTGKDTGFILASNDDRVGNFLAIAEGSLTDTDNPFAEELNDYLAEYVDATITEYDSITDAEIETAIAKAEAEQSFGARTLGTHWSGISNNWVAYASISDFAIQKHPLLKTKRGQGSTTNASSVGALMWQIGKAVSTVYYSNRTSASATAAKYAFESLGYTLDGDGYKNAATLSETSNSSTIYYSTTPAYIKNTLNGNRPIYTQGYAPAGGHAWVMDGHGTIELFRNFSF